MTAKRDQLILDFVEREESLIDTALFNMVHFWDNLSGKVSDDTPWPVAAMTVSQLAAWKDLRKRFQEILETE